MDVLKVFQRKPLIKNVLTISLLIIGFLLTSKTISVFACGETCYPSPGTSITCSPTQSCYTTGPSSQVCREDPGCSDGGGSGSGTSSCTGSTWGPCPTGQSCIYSFGSYACVTTGGGSGSGGSGSGGSGSSGYYCGEIVGGRSVSGTCPSGQTCEAGGSGSFQYYSCTGTATYYCGQVVSGRPVYGSCSGGQICLAQGSGSFGYYSCVDPDEVPHAEGEYGTMAECNAACVGICRAAAEGGFYCTPSSEDWEDEPATGDPGEAGQPAGFTFDIIPWIQNMYGLASGKDFGRFTGILYRIALPIAVVLGMIMVGVAGLGIMTSEGDPSKAMNAKNQLTSAIIGLLFVLLGAGILRALINTLFTGDGTITGI